MTANTSTQNPLLGDEYLSEPAVAASLGVSTRTLARRNAERQGPHRIERNIVAGRFGFYSSDTLIDDTLLN